MAKRAYCQSDTPGGSTGGEIMMSTIALFNSAAHMVLWMERSATMDSGVYIPMTSFLGGINLGGINLPKF